jgi:hypothetical protein
LAVHSPRPIPDSDLPASALSNRGSWVHGFIFVMGDGPDQRAVRKQGPQAKDLWLLSSCRGCFFSGTIGASADGPSPDAPAHSLDHLHGHRRAEMGSAFVVISRRCPCDQGILLLGEIVRK